MHCRFKAYHERHLGKSYACRKLLFDGQAMRRLLLRFFRSVPSRLTRKLAFFKQMQGPFYQVSAQAYL